MTGRLRDGDTAGRGGSSKTAEEGRVHHARWKNNNTVYAWKSPNARVWPPAERIFPAEEMQERYFVRFGSALASALVLLELAAIRKLSGFDVEWYEGLFLRRLRERLFAQPGYDASYRNSFDHHANTYQYEWIDLEAAMTIGKSPYYVVLISVAKAIAAEEGASGEIARVALKAFRFPKSAWEMA